MNPRWEDFDYEYMPEVVDNPMAWLGNGMTTAQVAGQFTTEYLDLKQIMKVPKPVNAEVKPGWPRFQETVEERAAAPEESPDKSPDKSEKNSTVVNGVVGTVLSTMVS